MSKVVVLLCSLEKEIQNLCVSALLNLTTNKPEKYEFVFVNSYHNVVVTDVYCFVRVHFGPLTVNSYLNFVLPVLSPLMAGFNHCC